MESLTQEVKLARQQCEDLKSYRIKMYEEADHIEKVSIKKMREKVQRVKGERSKVQKQIRDMRESHSRLQEKLIEADVTLQKAQEVILTMRKSMLSRSGPKEDPNLQMSQFVKSMASSRSSPHNKEDITHPEVCDST
jgi:septal ring factor EnvC (AmiA/AmiB activator)